MDIHRSKKQSAYDLCELLVFEDIQKRNLTSTMEFVGGASSAVKYHGFTFPPSKIPQAKFEERKKEENTRFRRFAGT